LGLGEHKRIRSAYTEIWLGFSELATKLEERGLENTEAYNWLAHDLFEEARHQALYVYHEAEELRFGTSPE